MSGVYHTDTGSTSLPVLSLRPLSKSPWHLSGICRSLWLGGVSGSHSTEGKGFENFLLLLFSNVSPTTRAITRVQTIVFELIQRFMYSTVQYTIIYKV